MLKTQGLTPVTREQGMDVARKMNAQYMECSSKEMKGVDEIFNQAIITVVANDRKNLEQRSETASPSKGGRRGSIAGALNIPGVGAARKKRRKCNFL